MPFLVKRVSHKECDNKPITAPSIKCKPSSRSSGLCAPTSHQPKPKLLIRTPAPLFPMMIAREATDLTAARIGQILIQALNIPPHCWACDPLPKTRAEFIPQFCDSQKPRFLIRAHACQQVC